MDEVRRQRRTVHARSWRLMGYTVLSFLQHHPRYGERAYRRLVLLSRGHIDPTWPEEVFRQLERARDRDREVWDEAVSYGAEALRRYEEERGEDPSIFYGSVV